MSDNKDEVITIPNLKYFKNNILFEQKKFSIESLVLKENFPDYDVFTIKNIEDNPIIFSQRLIDDMEKNVIRGIKSSQYYDIIF